MLKKILDNKLLIINFHVLLTAISDGHLTPDAANILTEIIELIHLD